MIDQVSHCEALDVEDLTRLLEGDISLSERKWTSEHHCRRHSAEFPASKNRRRFLRCISFRSLFDYCRDVARKRHMSRAGARRNIDPAMLDKRYEEYV